MADICIHAFVSGAVQGVWYRRSTQRQAQSKGVTGWAKNLADGRVEVMLCGEESAVKEVAQWLHQGPPNASVSQVSLETVEWQSFQKFQIS